MTLQIVEARVCAFRPILQFPNLISKRRRIALNDSHVTLQFANVTLQVTDVTLQFTDVTLNSGQAPVDGRKATRHRTVKVDNCGMQIADGGHDLGGRRFSAHLTVLTYECYLCVSYFL